MQDGVFPALLVVQHELQRDAGAVGPARVGRCRAVTGQVTRVGPLSAEIILISDPEHAIPVQVNRTGTRTIALGTGRSGQLSLPYLPQNSDVIAGDLLVSSGLGGVYPPGYPVGKITGVGRDPSQPLLSISASPLAALDRDPEILLVWFDSTVVEPAPAPPAAAGAD